MLYGSLGRRFGRRFDLAVKSPADAIDALIIMVPGFREHLQELEYGVHVRVGGDYREDEDLAVPCAPGETIALVPATLASGGKTRAVAGAVLFAADKLYFKTGYLSNVGLALMASGAAEVLARKPSGNSDYSATQNIEGASFSSGENTTGQGVGIPLIIGRNLVGSHVVGAQVLSDIGAFNTNTEAEAPGQGIQEEPDYFLGMGAESDSDHSDPDSVYGLSVSFSLSNVSWGDVAQAFATGFAVGGPVGGFGAAIAVAGYQAADVSLNDGHYSSLGGDDVSISDQQYSDSLDARSDIADTLGGDVSDLGGANDYSGGGGGWEGFSNEEAASE